MHLFIYLLIDMENIILMLNRLYIEMLQKILIPTFSMIYNFSDSE